MPRARSLRDLRRHRRTAGMARTCDGSNDVCLSVHSAYSTVDVVRDEEISVLVNGNPFWITERAEVAGPPSPENPKLMPPA